MIEATFAIVMFALMVNASLLWAEGKTILDYLFPKRYEKHQTIRDIYKMFRRMPK